VQTVAGGSPILVQAAARNSYPKISPDGAMLALKKDRGGIRIYRLNGGQPTPLQGVKESEYPIRFVDGGKSLLVADAGERELVLTLVDLSSGKRRPWKQFDSKLLGFGQFAVVTPDLKYYAYQTSRLTSVLYMVDNLR
jgi:hypothetical protein